jgi:hypothetical protein
VQFGDGSPRGYLRNWAFLQTEKSKLNSSKFNKKKPLDAF